MRGFLAIAVLCLSTAAVCAPAETAEVQAMCGVQAPGGQWGAAAQWIAGLSDKPFSAALTPEQHAAWNDFSKLSGSDWANLRKQYLDRIEVWRSRNLPSPPGSMAFYPFGGPD